jgi:hypothetical protein
LRAEGERDIRSIPLAEDYFIHSWADNRHDRRFWRWRRGWRGRRFIRGILLLLENDAAGYYERCQNQSQDEHFHEVLSPENHFKALPAGIL